MLEFRLATQAKGEGRNTAKYSSACQAIAFGSQLAVNAAGLPGEKGSIAFRNVLCLEAGEGSLRLPLPMDAASWRLNNGPEFRPGTRASITSDGSTLTLKTDASAGGDYAVIAVIGDGSFNNGLVYEAFNSLKPLKTNILVIINDNGMSISPTVGSMHEYLEVLSADAEEQYHKNRRAGIFEKFGFEYDGVYDGNDLAVMISRLKIIKEKLKTQTVNLHVLTKKGKGYSFCEEHPEATHGIGAGSPSAPAVEYSSVLGKTLTEIAAKDDKIVAVTAAMTGSLGLNPFFEKYPERAVDVGICEEHATILCASMAAEGYKPYYAVYSTFLQRSFDEIIIDICSQNLPVTMCIDRAGISGSDGETHQGEFDLSFLSLIPNLTIAVPKDINEFRKMLLLSSAFSGPLAIRYPKDGYNAFKGSSFEIGKWEIMCDGNDCAIIACGERMITLALAAAGHCAERGVSCCVVNARFVKPLDTEVLEGLKQDLIVTLEDNALIGGFGSLIDCYYSETRKQIKNFAYPDEFIPHGSVGELISKYGISVDKVSEYILKNANR